jgi:hypothetical protein
MRRRIYIITAIFLVAVIGYEIVFRVCTAKWGEVDMKSKPPRVYYSEDLSLPFPLLQVCFGLRTELPFGKVSLSGGSGAYVDGGRFYRRLPDGSWQDLTDAMVAHQNQESKP